MKAILGFTRMSVRGLNKVKRELGFVLMALNIRKVVAQRAENNQKFIKDNFYIISIEIVFFHYPRTLCPGLFYLYQLLADYLSSWRTGVVAGNVLIMSKRDLVFNIHT